LIDLISRASRLRTFNRALHLSETDLGAWPIDFVETVILWSQHSKLD